MHNAPSRSILTVFFLFTVIVKRLDDTSSDVQCLALEALNVIPKCIPEGFEFGPDNEDFIKSMFEQVLLHMDDKNVRMRGKVLGEFFLTTGTTVKNIYYYSYGFANVLSFCYSRNTKTSVAFSANLV